MLCAWLLPIGDNSWVLEELFIDNYTVAMIFIVYINFIFYRERIFVEDFLRDILRKVGGKENFWRYKS